MMLVTVHSVKATAVDNLFEFEITARLSEATAPQRFTFGYVESDEAPLTAEIKVWWGDHQGFPVGPYVASD